MFRHVSLILPNIDIVEPGFIASLLLDLLSYLAAGKDSVALECAIYRPETTFLDLVPTLQTFDQVQMRSWIIQVHVK
jgi:hypothetical protein